MTERPVLIAVVDDEESVVRALHRLFRSAGLDVLAFCNGRAFLDAMAERRFDCVVLDLHMPDVDGFEVQARLAEAGAGIPQVIITGHDTPESYRRAIDGGASAYLRKPVDGPTLLQTIEALVSGKASSDFNP